MFNAEIIRVCIVTNILLKYNYLLDLIDNK